MSILIKRLMMGFLALFTVLSLTSCDKSSDPVTTQENHFEAIGMVFRTSGIKAASILRGETADTLKGIADSTGEAIDVTFFNSDETEVAPPSGGQTLSWEIDNPSLFELWQHEGEEGGFEFHIKGLQTGETKIEFFIMHEGHADFRSGKIPVHIE